MRQDLIYAARVLRRSPIFAAAAVPSLGIGIAANAAIFALADALLLRGRPSSSIPWLQKMASIASTTNLVPAASLRTSPSTTTYW